MFNLECQLNYLDEEIILLIENNFKILNRKQIHIKPFFLYVYDMKILINFNVSGNINFLTVCTVYFSF